MFGRHVHHEVNVFFVLSVLDLSHFVGVNELRGVLFGEQVDAFDCGRFGLSEEADCVCCWRGCLLVAVLGLYDVDDFCWDGWLFFIPGFVRRLWVANISL